MSLPSSNDAGVSATAIALGYRHTCVIEASGGVKCWGSNTFGQLGIGSKGFQTSPVAVPGAREDVNMSGAVPRKEVLASFFFGVKVG